MNIHKLIDQIESVKKFFYRADENALIEISEEKYKTEIFGKLTEEQKKKAYEKAWEAKNFEIENYWKRANYFWAFQVASFAGYFSVIGSDFYLENKEVLYYVICIGFVTSLAWAFINIGSKTWQRHWEIHVDLLEEEITGPLYKIVTTDKTFSVTKINEIISRFFVAIWLVIGFKFLVNETTLEYSEFENIYFSIIFSTIAVIYFSIAMYHGYGRGRFEERKVRLFERQYKVGETETE
ncbi:hypothetical protein [Ulvibacterium sp.]|uniref:RipA family octameric membrane protein n=1 Tax=Ulvibacterium sp. TaxID=2665914 RepID=UPI002633D534|nr:hypothetical protein [Ulvibacterium sp.]